MAKRISASELKQWMIKSPEKLLIVDVRQDDVYGGHIAGSTNVPFHKVTKELPRIMEEAKGKDRVIFHCSLSQQRGPEASRLFSQALTASNSPTPEVYILNGGFVDWHQHRYTSDPALTQSYDAEHWKHGFQG